MTRNNNIGMQSLSTAGVSLSPQGLVVRSIAELSLRIRFPGVWARESTSTIERVLL